MLKKIFSYLYPITIYKKKSKLSSLLEITWVNGELVLDSENTNYSYGSLQRILRKGLKEIGFDAISKMDSVLVLGVGAGSVLRTLTDEIKCKATITGVEIDAEVIEIATTYFKLDEIKNVTIINDDAFEFVLKTTEKYDLIIIDVFQDTAMPNFLFEPFFSNRIGNLLQNNGYLLFNTMLLNIEAVQRNKNYCKQFNPNEYSVRTVPKVEKHNELIIVKNCRSK
jgi:spermidine synthase